MPNGAQALMKTLVDAGIDVCFTNPGTSEMHFVAALDSEPKMRAVLALFEGVATGAADGYARMADKPAATLLHLGCGLGNGLANLHNARKGKVPGREHRGRSRHLPHPIRRPAAVRHRDRGAQRVAGFCAHLPIHGRTQPRRSRRHRCGARPAGAGGHADPAGRRVLGRGRRGGRRATHAAAAGGGRCRRAGGGAGRALGRQGGAAAGGDGRCANPACSQRRRSRRTAA
jgi:hypothetical protein